MSSVSKNKNEKTPTPVKPPIEPPANQLNDKSWWNNFKSKPPSYTFEKINIIFSILGICGTFVIAGITYNQQQTIKGMDTVIQKLTDVSIANASILNTIDASFRPLVKTIQPKMVRNKDSAWIITKIQNFGQREAMDIEVQTWLIGTEGASGERYVIENSPSSVPFFLAPNLSTSFTTGVTRNFLSQLNTSVIFTKVKYTDILSNRVDSSYDHIQIGVGINNDVIYRRLRKEEIEEYTIVLKQYAANFN